MKLLNKLRLIILITLLNFFAFCCKYQYFNTNYGSIKLYKNKIFEAKFSMGLVPKIKGYWIKKKDTITLTSEYQSDSIKKVTLRNSISNVYDSCYVNREEMPSLTNLIFFAKNYSDTMYYCCPTSFLIKKYLYDSIQINIDTALSKIYPINLTDTLYVKIEYAFRHYTFLKNKKFLIENKKLIDIE